MSSLLLQVVVETTPDPGVVRIILFEQCPDTGGRSVSDIITSPPDRVQWALRQHLQRIPDLNALEHSA